MNHSFSRAAKAALFCSVSCFAFFSQAYATDTTVSSGTTQTSRQTLSNGDTLTVEQGAAIIPGGGDTAVDVGGKNNNTITNSGTLTSFINTIYADNATHLNVVNYGLINGTSQIIAATTPSNMSIINYGTIAASSNSAIYTSGGSNIFVSNYGTISAGDTSSVNFGGSTSSTLLNAGVISATNAAAVDASSSTGFNIFNTGRLQSTTETLILGSSGTVHNDGSIIATGTGANAIHATGNNNIVILGPGSQVVGAITSDTGRTGNVLEFNLGSGKSYAYTLTGPWSALDLNGRPMVADPVSAGVGAQETADEMLYRRIATVEQSLMRRMEQSGNDAANIWFDPYVARNTRSADDGTTGVSKFADDAYGLNAGIKLPTDIPLDVVLNLESSFLNLDNSSQKVETSSVMTGLFAPNLLRFGDVAFSAEALVGYSDHDAKRDVLTNNLASGHQEVTSDYNSYNGVVGFSGKYLHPLDAQTRLSLTIGADVEMERYDSYSESAYFAWSNRFLTQTVEKIGAGIDHTALGDRLTLNGGVGLEGRQLVGGRTSDYTIEGTPESFSGGYNNDLYFTGYLGARYNLTHNAAFYTTVSGAQSVHNVQDIEGDIGVSFKF